MQHHKYSLSELDSMMPWERQIYVEMLMNYIEMENEKIKSMNTGRAFFVPGLRSIPNILYRVS